MKKYLLLVASLLTPVIIGLIFILMLNQLFQTKQQLKDLKTIQQNQNAAVSQLRGAVDTLKADNQKNSSIIICMLKVPLAQRTTDLEAGCRNQAEVTPSAINTPIPTTGTSPQTTTNTTNNTINNPPERSFISPVVDVVNNVLKKVGL